MKNENWQGKILDVLGDNKWKSRRQIKNALGLDHKTQPMLTRAINSYLKYLTESGHITRAAAPDHIKSDKLDHVNYVYKSTGKIFIHGNRFDGFRKWFLKKQEQQKKDAELAEID